jgi:molybdopterin molybdotransferase
VKQRPGKPLYFGRRGKKLIFGLPGNPASVFTCFCEYVIPALERMSSKKSSVRELRVPLGNSFSKNTGLTHLLKGFYDGKLVFPLEAQESFRMSSFARANCIIQIEEEKNSYKEGASVEIHLLPWVII